MMRLNAKLKESETRINNLLAQVQTIAPAPSNICTLVSSRGSVCGTK